MATFDDANIAVYALSYDEADALRDFRDAHGITFKLISDPHSEVISAFGILNTLIDANDHPWYGIPYPGTFVLDTAGTITHKFFDNNLAVRAGPEQMLRALSGKDEIEVAATAIQETTVATPTKTQAVAVNVAFAGDKLGPIVQRDLVVRFQVPAGRHVYASPAPAGSVAVAVTLDDDPRVVERPMLRPPSEPHTLTGTGETMQVHNGTFELRLPVTLNASDPSMTEYELSGTVHWQACDNDVCDIPASQRFQITVPVIEAPAVALGNATGAAIEPNAMQHFQRMSQRRSK